MKKFILSLAVAVGLVSSLSAATLSATIQPNSASNVLSGGLAVSQFILASQATASNNIITMFDSPNNNLFYTNGAYTGVVSVTVSTNSIYTNYFGVLTTNSYSALIETNQTFLAATNTQPVRVGPLIVSSNSVVTLGNGVATIYYFYSGITVSNNGTAPLTFTMTYRQ